MADLIEITDVLTDENGDTVSSGDAHYAALASYNTTVGSPNEPGLISKVREQTESEASTYKHRPGIDKGTILLPLAEDNYGQEEGAPGLVRKIIVASSVDKPFYVNKGVMHLAKTNFFSSADGSTTQVDPNSAALIASVRAQTEEESENEWGAWRIKHGEIILPLANQKPETALTYIDNPGLISRVRTLNERNMNEAWPGLDQLVTSVDEICPFIKNGCLYLAESNNKGIKGIWTYDEEHSTVSGVDASADGGYNVPWDKVGDNTAMASRGVECGEIWLDGSFGNNIVNIYGTLYARVSPEGFLRFIIYPEYF